MSVVLLQDGFENLDLLSSCYTYTGDAVSSTSSPRSGSRHLRCTLAAGATGSHYVSYLSVDAGSQLPWQYASYFLPYGSAGGFDLSVNYQTDVGVTATNLQQIIVINVGDGATSASIVIRSTAGNGASTRKLTLATATATVDLYTGWSASTKFDIRLKGWVNSSGVGYCEAWVFTNGSDTILGHGYLPITIAAAQGYLHVGAIPVLASTLFLEGTQNHDFDDLVVRVGVTATESSDCGSGAITLLPVDGAGASATMICVPTAPDTLNYQAVNNPVTDSDATKDADYNNSVKGATLHKDFYDIGSYLGASEAKYVSAHVRHLAHTAGGGGADINHQMGFSDGTEFGEGAVLPGVGDAGEWGARMIEAKRAGGAIDDAYVAALELVVKKYTNVGGLNDKRFTHVFAQVYDTSGRTPMTDNWLTATPTTAALVLTGYAPTVTVAAGAAPQTLTPSPVTIPIVVAAPSIALSLTLTPSPVAIPILTVAPVVSKSYTLAPSPVAITLVLPAPAITKTKTLTPSPIAIPILAVAPVVSKSLILSPSPVTISILTDAPTITKSRTLSPSALAIPIVVPAPTITRTLTLTPSPVAISIITVAPVITRSLTLTPSALAIPLQIPSPVVSTALTLTPAPVTIPILTVAPTVSKSYALTPSPVAVPLVLPVPSITKSLTLTPAPLAIPLVLPAPSVVVSGGPLTLSPDPVAIPMVLPTPTLARSLTLSPSPVAIPILVPAPTLQKALSIAPTPVVVVLALPAPTITLTGTITLTPAPVQVILVLPPPTISIAVTITVPIIVGGCVALVQLIDVRTWLSSAIASLYTATLVVYTPSGFTPPVEVELSGSGFIEVLLSWAPSGFVSLATSPIPSNFVEYMVDTVPSGYETEPQQVAVPSGFVKDSNDRHLWDL